MRLVREIALLCVISLFLLSGCASDGTPKIASLDVDMILPPAGTATMDPAELNGLMSDIQERNTAVEDDPDWIEQSYKGMMVRRLTNVTEEEAPFYREYLDGGAAYVIVHPSFFSFFHYPRKLIDNKASRASRYNVVEVLLNKDPRSPQFALLQAQERRMRDFLEFKSTEKKLIIMIVPKNYGKYTGYTYRKGRDEYMRYLNEVTNFSKSVLFVESMDPNRGSLTQDDALKLMEFLLSVNAKRVYVGGAYVGRCLEDFYNILTREWGEEGIYVIPELADISPRELNPQIAISILRPDGLIDTAMATELLQKDVYRVMERTPEITNLH
jgi:hypothetical protein